MSLKQGIYVGETPAVLANGRPVKRGDVVVVDSAGEDAYLLARLASVTAAKRAPKRRTRTPNPETSE